MHVEDSDITLNVCLGKQFTGGEMYFLGRRCGSHYSSGTHEQVLHLECNLSSRLTIYAFIQNVIFLVA